MSDDYRLLKAPWHGKAEATPLNPTGTLNAEDTHGIRLLDELCEHLTTAYIAEKMGNRSAFLAAEHATTSFLAKLSHHDLELMVLNATASHATGRALFAAQAIPDSVPTEWGTS